MSCQGSSKATPAGAGQRGNGLDQLSWWGDLARQAYTAIDGSLQGFEEPPAVVAPAEGGMTGSEAEMVKVSGGR